MAVGAGQLGAVLHYQLYDGLPLMEKWLTLTNTSPGEGQGQGEAVRWWPGHCTVCTVCTALSALPALSALSALL